MASWFRRKKSAFELPAYRRLDKAVSFGLPDELAEQERSDAFRQSRDSVESGLLQPPLRPDDDQPFFSELINPGGELFTITLPDGESCLPIFSEPLRTLDYVRTWIRGEKHLYFSSTPRQLTEMLVKLQQEGLKSFVLDPCPRCDITLVVRSESLRTPEDVLRVWAVSQATRIARANLYYDYALRIARDGRMEVARDVALETVGHVSMHDARPHMLLGRLGVALKDRRLVREARAFLRVLRDDQLEKQLAAEAKSGKPDFFAKD